MLIVWSEEDNCYLVHLPDFPEQRYRTHGESYEEAAKNGYEVLQLLLEDNSAVNDSAIESQSVELEPF